MSVQSHTFKGKSVATFVTQDGQVINANVENLTILCDDGMDEWSLGYVTEFTLPPVSTYALEGAMVEIDDSGIIFEIRRNNHG